MNTDLYEIGVNLMLGDGSNAERDDVIDKSTALQHAADGLSGEFQLSNSAVLDFASAASGIATTWSLAADSAERFAEAANRTNSTTSNGDEEFGSLTSSPEMAPFDPAGGVTSALTSGLADRVGSLFSAASEQANAVSSQRFSIENYPSETGGSAADLRCAIGGGDARPAAADSDWFTYHSVWAAQDHFNDNQIQELYDNRGSRNEPYGAAPQRYQALLERVNLSGLEYGTAGATHLAAPGGTDGGQKTGISQTSDGILDHGVQTETEHAVGPKISRQPGTRLNAEYFGALSDQLAIDNGLLDEVLSGEVAGLGTATGAVGAKSGHVSDTTNADNFGTYGLLTQLSPDVVPELASESNELTDVMKERTKNSQTTRSDIHLSGRHVVDERQFGSEFGPLHALDKGAASASVEGREIGQARALAETDAAAFAGPPGWLVALTGAVVMELSNSTRHSYSGSAGLAANRGTQLGPSGTRGDPLHVKVLVQPAAYQTHMPAGSTANLPSQSLPVPGQVLFAP